MQLRAKLVRVCGGGGGLGAWVDPDPGDLPGSHFITGRAPRAATFRFQAGKVVRALSVYFLHRAALILTTPIGMPHKKRFCDSARGSRLRAGATLGWNFFCSRATFCNSRPRAARFFSWRIGVRILVARIQKVKGTCQLRRIDTWALNLTQRLGHLLGNSASSGFIRGVFICLAWNIRGRLLEQ